MNLGPPKPLSEIMFNKFDIDKSGSIDSKEFQQLCFALGYALIDSELQVALDSLDHDKSGKIEQKEFSTWWSNSERWNQLKLNEAELAKRKSAAEAFNNYSQTGIVYSNDFDDLYKDLIESKLTTKDKSIALRELDTNGDHKIVFNEYIAWLNKQGSINNNGL